MLMGIVVMVASVPVVIVVVVVRTIQLREGHRAPTVIGVVVEVALFIDCEAVKVGFHVSQAETFSSDPVINVRGNPTETLGVAAVNTSLAATHDEKEAVDHFVEKCRDEESTVVLCVFQDRTGEDDERFVATFRASPFAQSCCANNRTVVPPCRCHVWMTPIPSHTSAKLVCKEEVVRG